MCKSLKMKRVSLILLVPLLLGTSCSGEEKNTVPTTTLGDLFENSSAPETVPPLRVEGWEMQELYPARNLAEECIASARPPDIVLPDEGPETVVVQSGDTLSGIAAEHDTTVDAFMRANGLSNPNSLRVGQVLLIPRERDEEIEGIVGPDITMEELSCSIDTGAEAHGPNGLPVGRNGKIEIKIVWPRIEGPQEAPRVNGRLLGLTQGAAAEFLDDAITAVENNGYACREVIDGRCLWLEHEYEVMLSTDEVLSLRNIERRLVSGAAGDAAETFTETFDLETGQPILIYELFDPDTDWVDALSAEAITRLESEPWVDERRHIGAGPEEENFALYNITRGGLVLSFAPFSVGGSGSNTASITIPYRSLEGYWQPNGFVEFLVASIE